MKNFGPFHRRCLLPQPLALVEAAAGKVAERDDWDNGTDGL